MPLAHPLPPSSEALDQADLADMEACIGAGGLSPDEQRRLIAEVKALNGERAGLLAAVQALRGRPR